MYNTFVSLTALLCLLFIHNPSLSQSDFDHKIKFVELGEVEDGNNDFENWNSLDSIFENVEIVLLGEQSHGDGTTVETKTKLIKYLHQKHGFEILAFESGLYDCHKAWENVLEGGDIKHNLARSVFSLWSTIKQFNPLVDYLDNSLAKDENPLQLVGFDNQLTGKLSTEELIPELQDFCLKNSNLFSFHNQFNSLQESINLMGSGRFKKYKKEAAKRDIEFIDQIIAELNQTESSSDRDLWKQILVSLKSYISDTRLGTDFRDKQMADNFNFIKKNNPNKKIICYGATSHFLTNSENVRMKSLFVRLLGGNYYRKTKMMGTYLKNKYGDRLYSVGFVAHEGTYGLTRSHKLSVPKHNTMEYLIGQTDCNNCFIDLNKSEDWTNIYSRPLGHRYMTNNISEVLDGVIFNRYMAPSKMDWRFFKKIYPENKYITMEDIIKYENKEK